MKRGKYSTYEWRSFFADETPRKKLRILWKLKHGMVSLFLASLPTEEVWKEKTFAEKRSFVFFHKFLAKFLLLYNAIWQGFSESTVIWHHFDWNFSILILSKSKVQLTKIIKSLEKCATLDFMQFFHDNLKRLSINSAKTQKICVLVSQSTTLSDKTGYKE